MHVEIPCIPGLSHVPQFQWHVTFSVAQVMNKSDITQTSFICERLSVTCLLCEGQIVVLPWNCLTLQC